ncbi:MAG: LysR family transcriptional regulator [Nitrospiraceae bacterium]|nr:MAG: LysR family transcriptional regulator [Nitrospiraceae bacterium]
MNIRSKIWLEIDGDTVFGSGRRALLEGIARHGSINKAASEIHISYRKALSYIRAMEYRLGFVLVNSKTGGEGGGGSSLTRETEGFLMKYKMLEEGINEMLDKKFLEVFGPKAHRKRPLKSVNQEEG